MASTTDAASTPPGSVGPDIERLAKSLYKACVDDEIENDHPGIVFTQGSLLDFNIIQHNDILTLVAVAQRLTDQKLFKPVTDNGMVGWMLRTPDEAVKYRSLGPEQAIVYQIIDEAGEDGMWTKTIRQRSNLHDAVYKDCIKFLTNKGMIADMKSVEYPTRKMYIKATLRPSERATGGSWFTSGTLDEEFVNHVTHALYTEIMKKTFYYSRGGGAHKRKAKISPEEVREAKAARAQGLGPRIKTESEPTDVRETRHSEFQRHLPMPQEYQGYPDVDQLTEFIDNSGISKTVLSAVDIQQVLDVLVFDDKIEEIQRGDAIIYRGLRKGLLDESQRGSLLNEMPCGRCPVFDLCEEGGPVAPSNCEYFQDWLEF